MNSSFSERRFTRTVLSCPIPLEESTLAAFHRVNGNMRRILGCNLKICRAWFDLLMAHIVHGNPNRKPLFRPGRYKTGQRTLFHMAGIVSIRMPSPQELQLMDNCITASCLPSVFPAGLPTCFKTSIPISKKSSHRLATF
jgi:hypothetical protein